MVVITTGYRVNTLHQHIDTQSIVTCQLIKYVIDIKLVRQYKCRMYNNIIYYNDNDYELLILYTIL